VADSNAAIVTSTGQTVREESALREHWRTLKVATRLGWQVEGNWADPLVFFIFAILRPLATAFILVLMYQVIAGGQRGSYFDYLYLSNAFFVLVIQTMSGLAWTVLDDRENYKMLKYIYTSPARKFSYLIGRAMAKISLGLMTTAILILVGVLFLGLNLTISNIEWGWLALYFPIGMIALLGMGMVLAGIALVVARHGAAIGEVTAGSLLLFSGAYFPVDVLPPFLQFVSLCVPITYWLEGMRRAFNGGPMMQTVTLPGGRVIETPISPILASLDNVQLLVILVISAAVSAVFAVFFFRWIENQAKERGMIDRLTGY
jgi:ABC-2 type transport system permease protein